MEQEFHLNFSCRDLLGNYLDVCDLTVLILDDTLIIKLFTGQGLNHT